LRYVDTRKDAMKAFLGMELLNSCNSATVRDYIRGIESINH